MRRLRLLRRDRRGAATIEFALWSAMFFMGMLVALDFALWRTQQLRLGSAVEQGSMLAFNGRAALDATGVAGIKTYVAAVADMAGAGAVTVTAGCNDGTAACVGTNRPCKCLTSAAKGSYTFGATLTCGTSCGDSTSAGYYLVLRASRTYQSSILPADLLSGRTMTDTAIVRLQ